MSAKILIFKPRKEGTQNTRRTVDISKMDPFQLESDVVDLNEEYLNKRKDALVITDQDERSLTRIAKEVDQKDIIDAISRQFGHALEHPEQLHQAKFIERLLTSDADDRQSRLEVYTGEALNSPHRQIGIYNIYLSQAIGQLLASYKGQGLRGLFRDKDAELERLQQDISALIKAVFLDLELSFEEYVAEVMMQSNQQQHSLVNTVEHTSNGLDELNSTLERLVSEIALNALNAKEAETVADENLMDIKIAGGVIEGVVRVVDEISNKLAEVEEIAAKTNILAVTAAMEAARMGEQGSAFAVISDEIRRLANACKSFGDDVSEIVDKSHDVSEVADSKLGSMTPKLQRAYDLAKLLTVDMEAQLGASNTLQELLDHIRRSNTLAARKIGMELLATREPFPKS